MASSPELTQSPWPQISQSTERAAQGETDCDIPAGDSEKSADKNTDDQMRETESRCSEVGWRFGVIWQWKKEEKKTPTEQEQDDLETGGRIWRVIGILMKTTTTTEYSA